jgi:hypothetical protein
MPSVISLSRSRLVGLFSAMIFNLLSKCVISAVCSAIQKKTYVEYLLDLFLYESEEEQKAWIAEHTAEITHLERRLKIMAENKPTNRERLREITDGIEQGIKELFESEKYMRYLSVMSRFHRYSVNNTMLIYMQKPDATLVAGYNKWKDQFERHVKKGEHGITIIAPTPYKKKIEEQKLDPDTKAPILDKDGKIVKPAASSSSARSLVTGNIPS